MGGREMSDTPETDAKIICSSHTSFKGVGGVVVSEFARRLERERDEAREIIKKLDETILEMSPRHINSVTMCGRYPCWMVWLPKNGRVERKSLSAAVLEFIDQLKEGEK